MKKKCHKYKLHICLPFSTKIKLFRYEPKRRKAVKTEKKQQQVSLTFLHDNSIAVFI